MITSTKTEDYVAALLDKGTQLNFNCDRDNSGFADMPNRHEKLFLFGRSGKSFARVSLQMFYLLSIMYLSSYMTFYGYGYYNQYKKEASKEGFITLCVALVVCPLLMILIILVFIPSILAKFTIITNVRINALYDE